jgi:hypothetical protein
MKTIKIKPVQVIGNCPVGLTLADEFLIEGLRLENPNESRICFLSISQLPIGQGIWQLQSEERFFSHVSCPGCTLHPDQENRVVFLLGHADKWKLCQLISEYLALSKQYGESDIARQAKEAAILYQNRGQYLQATHQMEMALQELKQTAHLQE